MVSAPSQALDDKESEVELEKTKNEVLRKIGRNMLLFQMMEHMLKFLVANGKIAGHVSELATSQEQQVATIQTQTMGQLVGQFVENTYGESKESAQNQAELKEAYVSFTFRAQTDSAFYESKKKALAAIVADRNDLIHHLLPRLNQDSIENWMLVDQYLDQQHKKLLPEIETLKSIVAAMQEGKKLLTEALSSDEAKKLFE